MVGPDGEPPVLAPGGGVGEDPVHEVGQPPRLQDVADELRVGVRDDDDGGGQLLHRPPQQRLHVRGKLQTRHQGQDVLLDVHINKSPCTPPLHLRQNAWGDQPWTLRSRAED